MGFHKESEKITFVCRKITGIQGQNGFENGKVESRRHPTPIGKIIKRSSFLYRPAGGASRPEQLGCWLGQWDVEWGGYGERIK